MAKLQNTATMPKQKSPPVNIVPTSIGFRLEETSRRILAKRAAQLGVSPHELARYYVMEALNAADERRALRESLEALHRTMVASREDVAIATEAILQNTGKMIDEDVFAWVKRNLKMPCSRSPDQ
ncbi:MAG: hypothetical protein WCS94_10480 [Verrucomicrobiota bacterium]